MNLLAVDVVEPEVGLTSVPLIAGVTILEVIGKRQNARERANAQ